MNYTISVIVSKCEGDWIYGERLVDTTFPLSSWEDACLLGESHRAPGMSVVIRPNYNEEEDGVKFFREWRSMHGVVFQEVRFVFGAGGV